jgi:hypothetical protein
VVILALAELLELDMVHEKESGYLFVELCVTPCHRVLLTVLILADLLGIKPY